MKSPEMKDGLYKCEICGTYHKRIGSHVSLKHKIKIKDYYDMYHKKDDEGICDCGKPTRFYSFSKSN